MKKRKRERTNLNDTDISGSRELSGVNKETGKSGGKNSHELLGRGKINEVKSMLISFCLRPELCQVHEMSYEKINEFSSHQPPNNFNLICSMLNYF